MRSLVAMEMFLFASVGKEHGDRTRNKRRVLKAINFILNPMMTGCSVPTKGHLLNAV